MMMRRAVFLDRDGTINAMVYHPEFGLVDSPANPDEFRLLPGAAEAVQRINAMQILAVVVSNQPGIAKGKMTPTLLAATNEKMEQDLAQSGAHLDAVSYCLHHPDAVNPAYRQACSCRKPQPGLLLAAAEDLHIDLHASFMVGDGITDVLAGQAAGVTTFFLGSGKCDACREMERLGAAPDYIVPSLVEAVARIQMLILAENKLS
jgi:D-glycero-D-manno-heptose 1,7-bisphosphate phosphatase